jgi:hypothetical protein
MSAKRRRRTMEDEDITQELFLDSSSEDKLMSHDSDSDQDESQDNTQQTENTQSQHGAPVIHRFTGGPSGIRHNEAPTINKDLTSLSVFMLFFLEIIQLLVVETNRYYTSTSTH